MYMVITLNMFGLFSATKMKDIELSNKNILLHRAKVITQLCPLINLCQRARVLNNHSFSPASYRTLTIAVKEKKRKEKKNTHTRKTTFH